MINKNQIDYSIVIPAYNEEVYLPNTLEKVKVAMSRVKNFTGEIVVTDNNSTDDTALIAKNAGAKVVFEEHQQISKSRNTGAKNSSGKYIIFVDSDTQISAKLLKKTLKALKSGKCCGGGTIVEFDGKISFFGEKSLELWVGLSKLFKLACGAYVFCTREAFNQTGGFDERYYASEEIHFSIALQRWGKKRCQRFVILKEPIVTSNRKLEWYNSWELFKIVVNMLLHFRPLRSKEACSQIWYSRPQK